MILDLTRFIREERPYWEELNGILESLATRTGTSPSLTETRRFYYLYRRTASGLSSLGAFSGEPELRAYLDDLVGRAYAEIHEIRADAYRIKMWLWFTRTLPQTFRRRHYAFGVAVAATLAGALFGAGAVAFDPNAKAALLPFSHLQGNPSDRVAEEEEQTEDRLQGNKSTFAASLMTNNIKVSILALALGVTWGFGTLVLLFFNGVILGAVVLDYVRAGESVFLAGWLLPHGSIEIPAILLAGQAGLVLGHAMIGWGSSDRLRERLRASGPDLMTLIFGVAILLVWAGIVESFFSQYHEPVLPYAVKIAFGLVEMILLFTFLTISGRNKTIEPPAKESLPHA